MDCSVEDCSRPRYLRGWCRPHYRRFLRTGSVEGLKERRTGCLVPDCPRAHCGKGYCEKHLRVFNRYGDATYIDNPKPRTCEGCPAIFMPRHLLHRLCAECVDARKRASDARHRAETAEARNAAQKLYYQANLQALRSYQLQYALEHKEQKRAYDARYRVENADKRAFNEQKRQVVKRGCRELYPFTKDELEQRMSMFGHRCWICGASASQLDHVKPISKGGIHALCNLRPACGDCNLRKSNKWPFSPSDATWLSGVAA